MIKILKWVFASFIFITISCSEEISSDQVEIEELVSGFYSWYSNQILDENHLEYQPDFVADSNGMTTLNLVAVERNLLVQGFHKDLIKEYSADFNTCLQHLKTIQFDSIKTFDGLSDYEDIECDFFNSNRWTFDMESHDGVELENFEVLDDNKAIVNCSIFNQAEGFRMYWEHKFLRISLVKEDNLWKIRQIEVVFPDK